LISDIMFNSVFPEREIENERNVILDEITSYKDTPSENIFDEFDEVALLGHPLAHNILGTEKSLAGITRKELIQFHQKHYFSNSPVLFFMGDVPFEAVVKHARLHLGNLQFQHQPSPVYPLIYQPSNKTLKEDTYQTHFITGMPVPGYMSEDKIALLMLNNLLGGPSMNSLLNMSLREKNGIAYNVESTYMSYAQAGTISIYFGTDEKNMAKSKRLVYRELERLRTKKMSDSKVRQLQQQFYGQVAIARENNENTFLTFGKNILRHNTYNTLANIKEQINRVDANRLFQLANLYLNPESYSTLTIS